MLYFIKGKVEKKGDKFIILESGNLGFKVFVPQSTILEIKEKERLKLYTHIYFYENVIEFYGFKTQEELSLFELLISVSGVGPKVALLLLSLGPIKFLVSAIVKGDINYLVKVAGVGRKIAQKIIFELQDKMDKLRIGPLEELPEDIDVIEALKSLGYGIKESQEILKKIPIEKYKTSKERLKEALRLLTNQ